MNNVQLTRRTETADTAAQRDGPGKSGTAEKLPLLGWRSRWQRGTHVTLLSLDGTIYPLGEQVTFELKIQNTGKDLVMVPWTPHLGDLEPVDPDASYKYRIGVVVLRFEDPEGREFSLGESLYGSEDDPGTLRELLPGQWFTVRGRERIESNSPDWGQGDCGSLVGSTQKSTAILGKTTAATHPRMGER